MDRNIILEVRNLSVAIGGNNILSSVNFEVIAGQRVGMAGPSGSGKTMLAWTLVGGQPDDAEVTGNAMFCSKDTCHELLNSSTDELSVVLGSEIAIIPQNPFSSLNPARTCGDQIIEAIHNDSLSRAEAIERGHSTLQTMGFSDPDRIYQSYPHQLSGGQLQRVVIAMAIINKPSFLIADEPTTALDATTTSHILHLLDSWITENNASLLLVSHDWSVLSKMCSTIVSLEQGEVISTMKVGEVDTSGKILRGKALEGTSESFADNRPAPILVVDHLTKSFAVSGQRGKQIIAVNDVSFNIAKGKSLGIVGESGSGKSTIAKLLTGLEVADDGKMSFDKIDINYRRNPGLRKEIQMIFQDPYSALYPHRSVGYSIEEPLKLHHNLNVSERKKRALELLKLVDLNPAYYDRLPGRLSGGERQRVQIARALSVDPKLLICDECIAGLDIPIQARILELIRSLSENRGISVIFISHDLAAVRFVCNNVVVMSHGEIIERGTIQSILGNPQHPITQNLVSSTILFDQL